MKKIDLDILEKDDLRIEVEKLIDEKIDSLKTEIANKDVKLLSRKEASEFLGISAPTLDKYTELGIVKGYRLAGRPIYKRNDLITSLQGVEIRKYSRG